MEKKMKQESRFGTAPIKKLNAFGRIAERFFNDAPGAL